MLEDSKYSLSTSFPIPIMFVPCFTEEGQLLCTATSHLLQRAMMSEEPKALSFCLTSTDAVLPWAVLTSVAPVPTCQHFIVVQTDTGNSGESWKLQLLLPLLNEQWLISLVSVNLLVSLLKWRKHLEQDTGEERLKKDWSHCPKPEFN